MGRQLKKDKFDLMSKNPDNWKGVFYVNRNDPRIIVPKLIPSLGWTLNFGSVYAYLGLIAIILIFVTAHFFL